MKVLLIGDIVGKPGRQALETLLAKVKRERKIDFTIANGENAAGGVGLTPRIVEEILISGVDVITSGNHIWRKKEIFELIARESRLLRPANYPKGAPGHGFCIYNCGHEKIAVINVVGRVFMEALEDPFLAAEEILKEVEKETSNIFVDMHAEATSEKMALAFYLDGKVTAVFGTHTHVQTADEKILKKGTAYITDLGMTGPLDSIIGVNSQQVLERFRSGLPVRFEVASGDIQMQGAIVDFDPKTGKPVSIKRIVEFLK